MSQNHGTKGRRTPLTLGQQQQHQHHHSKSNARKASSDSNSSSTTTVDSRSAAIVAAAMQNNKDQAEQLKQKMSAELTAAATITGPKSAKENALRKMMQQQQQQQQQRNNQSNTAVVAAADSPTSNDDVILIGDDEPVDETVATTKKESKREKNGAKKDNNGTTKTAAAGHANGNGNGKAAEPVAVPVVAAPQPAAVEATVTESSRQKVLREKHEKEEAERAKQQEAREIEAALAAFQAQDDAEKATTTAVAAAAETADGPKTPEKARRTKAAVVTPSKTKTPTSKPTTPKAAAAAVVTAEVVPSTPASPSTKSTAASEDDIMEPLCMETESMDAVEPPASPPPAAAVVSVSPKASTGKILKFTQSPVPAAAGRASTRLSPFAARRRSGDLNAAAVDAAVNLSTVSEQSNEHSRYGSPAVVAATNAATDESDSRKYSGSLRQITCRRSMRPLRELAMQQSTRETYRRTRTELDDYSISSTNVTVGSEIGGDQAMADGGDADADVLIAPDSPPVAAVRGRKRLGGATAGGSEPDLVTVGLLESPKKPRLDLSGFFGMMASPVTLLRNKFSRTSLLCSTPNAKKLDVDAVADEEDSGDGLTAEIEGRTNPEIETGVEEETAIVTDEDAVMQVDDTEPKAPESEDVAVKSADQTDLEAVVAETVVADGEGEACTADNIAVDAIVVEGEEKPVAATAETDDDVTVTVSKPKKLGSCAVM